MDRTKVSVAGHLVDFDESVSEEVIRKFKGTPQEDLEPLFVKARAKGQGKFHPGYGDQYYGLTRQANGVYYLNEYDY